MSEQESEKVYHLTVDLETDWGGRVDSVEGIRKGLPIILTMINERKLKALFFISTELLENFGKNDGALTNVDIMERLIKHKIGSHGHFHMEYDNIGRLFEDKRLSELVLAGFGVENPPFRPPRFNRIGENLSLPYSNRKNHISLLKCAWFNARPKKDDIFYLHPFDIIGGSKAPSMFCKLWYSRPKKALQVLANVLDRLEGDNQFR